MSATAFAAVLPNLAGVAMLLLGLRLPLRGERDVEGAARSVAWQGALLALAAGAAASGGAGPHLWLLACGAIGGRALLLPVLMRSAAGSGMTAGAGSTTAPARAIVRLLAGGGLASLAAAVVLPAGAALGSGMREGLALSLAILLVGLLAMLGRRRAPLDLLGLIAAENGALLALVHAGAAAPGAVALAVFSPGLVACVALASRGGFAFADALPWPFRR